MADLTITTPGSTKVRCRLFGHRWKAWRVYRQPGPGHWGWYTQRRCRRCGLVEVLAPPGPESDHPPLAP